MRWSLRTRLAVLSATYCGFTRPGRRALTQAKPSTLCGCAKVRSKHSRRLRLGFAEQIFISNILDVQGRSFASALLLFEVCRTSNLPFWKGFNFVRAKPPLRQAESRFAKPRFSLWKGFNFVRAKPPLQQAESRFAKPRISFWKGFNFVRAKPPLW